jgi:hypothetical protein
MQQQVLVAMALHLQLVVHLSPMQVAEVVEIMLQLEALLLAVQAVQAAVVVVEIQVLAERLELQIQVVEVEVLGQLL